MTVKELIEKLQTVNPELMVFIKGYEGGYEDAKFTGEAYDFTLDYHKEWWYGPHKKNTDAELNPISGDGGVTGITL